MRALPIALVAVVGFGLVLAAEQQSTARPANTATADDLLQGLKNPSRWLTFSGDYTGQRHSPLKQLTPQNVAGLVPQWSYQTDVDFDARRRLTISEEDTSTPSARFEFRDRLNRQIASR